jgi:hypothetical protein
MSVETLICSLTQDEKRYALELLWASLRGDAQGYLKTTRSHCDFPPVKG